MLLAPIPLFVDLDKTLIRSDLLVESVAGLLRRAPLKIFSFIPRLISPSRAGMKEWLANRVPLDPALLPYRDEVFKLIEERKAAGQKIILATASNQKYAEAISEYLGLFDNVIASDSETNLIGRTKLEAILIEVKRLGGTEFDYVGDSVVDIPIFKKSAKSYLLNGSQIARSRICSAVPDITVLSEDSTWLKNFIKQLRPHQWVKNVLLFIPLIAAHEWANMQLLLKVLAATVFFSIVASAIYVLNDFVDVERDRSHPTKRHRPFASGGLPLWQAPITFMVLTAIALIGSLYYVNYNFAFVLTGYLAANAFYSFWLKQKVMIDVVLLTLLYVLRIVAGGAATGLLVSDWLLSFCLFFFFSLAFGKRYQELLGSSGKDQLSGPGMVRGYRAIDNLLVQAAGISSGFLSVMVVALYVRSDEVVALYESPRVLWFVCPLILYWIGRFWIVVSRGLMPDDPIVFALKDRISYLVAILIAGVGFLAHGYTINL